LLLLLLLLHDLYSANFEDRVGAAAVPFSHRQKSTTYYWNSTARRSGPDIALHQYSIGVAVTDSPRRPRDVQVKAIGAVRKQQHSVSGPSSVYSYAFITDSGSRPDCSCSSVGMNGPYPGIAPGGYSIHYTNTNPNPYPGANPG